METALIKAYTETSNQQFEVVLNKLWKRLDKKPCCGVLGKKDTVKFLNSVCEFVEREKKNWKDAPDLEDGVVDKWLKILDPGNHKVVAWEEVLRAIGSPEVLRLCW